MGLGLIGILSALPSAAADPAPIFVDRSADVGLGFEHRNGMSGKWYFPEINGAGVALFDYDRDGDLDIYLMQGAELGAGTAQEEGKAAARRIPPAGAGDRLWRNELISPSGDGTLRFVDVTEAAGIEAHGYGMAVAAADFDNDGWVDLYVANFGSNQLWRNRGADAEGRVSFEDVTAAWRAEDRRWSSTLAVLDYDRDGWLDLFVGNYLRFAFVEQKECRSVTGQRDYCHPSSYPAEQDLLFRNLGGQGKAGFAEVSATALPERGYHPSLGSVAFDADGDGWTDLYVANDDQPNQLWLNQGADAAGEVRFVESALLTGCAVNSRGQPEASMGVDAADFDNDGDEDLFMTHLGGQTNTLFANSEGTFTDITTRVGLGAPSLPFTGFGTAFLDVDLDGWLDLVVVNGAVQSNDLLRRRGDPYPFHERDLLFRNRGKDGRGQVRFENWTARSGLQSSAVSRGLAVGDVDNDGDTDLVVLDNNGPARLLLAQGKPGGEWIGLRLVDPSLRRDPLGTRAALVRRDGTALWRRMRIDGSYASSHDPRVLLGLGVGSGGSAAWKELVVHWPDASVEIFPVPPTGRYSVVEKGRGKPRTASRHSPNPTGNRPPKGSR